MLKRTKLTLAVLTATLIIGFAVSSASATHLRVSSQNFRFTWTVLRFRFFGGIINPTIECPLTLEGSFHSATINKVENALIGYITRATFASAACTGGHVTILQEQLPWHLTYNGFTGSLPRPTGMKLLLHTTAFILETLGVLCLYRENGTERAKGTINLNASGQATSISPDTSIRMPKFSGGGSCPSESGFEGNANEPTVLGSTTKITITLI